MYVCMQHNVKHNTCTWWCDQFETETWQCDNHNGQNWIRSGDIITQSNTSHIDGLVQERRNSSALAVELCLSCTKPGIAWLSGVNMTFFSTLSQSYAPFYVNKASEDAPPRRSPNQREWKYRDGHQRGYIRPMRQKMESFLKAPLTSVNTMFETDRVIIPHKCTHQVWIGLHEYFFRLWSETTIFSHFVATGGSKCGQHGPKGNQFWTLTQ